MTLEARKALAVLFLLLVLLPLARWLLGPLGAGALGVLAWLLLALVGAAVVGY